MTTPEKKSAFEKAANEIIEQTIREYRVMFATVMIDASAEDQQKSETTEGAAQ